ncbi:hypothetical protein [Frankia sp. Cr1]|uniref:hypothetical protein n=1 Tax=Frankia sp. Cr1 TaxID=3073931 RepID=UPI002AD4781A|nr:hypothetical protein [Frankia sp. Cr1]
MSISAGPAVALTVVVANLTGLVTNVLTSDWSWTLGAALIALTVVGAVLAGLAAAAGTRGRGRVSVRIGGGSTVTDSITDADRAATVVDRVDGSDLNQSGIHARGGTARRRVKDSTLTRSGIVIRP